MSAYYMAIEVGKVDAGRSFPDIDVVLNDLTETDGSAREGTETMEHPCLDIFRSPTREWSNEELLDLIRKSEGGVR